MIMIPDTQVSWVDSNTAWQLILALRGYIRAHRWTHDGVVGSIGLTLDAAKLPCLSSPEAALLTVAGDGTWTARMPLTAAAKYLFDLYLPICLTSANRPLTIGHLGQSLDGRIATESGASCYVTGPENIVHLHRMRALCDAIVVGAATIRHDNPQLTTRRVTGNNPVRVVLDSQRRLTADYNVFQDGATTTLVFCDAALAGRDTLGNAHVIGVPLVKGRLQLSAVLEQLHARDLYGVFIEGGGITVSYFLQENLLDQLQIAIAPLLIGSGRPGITLPVIQDLNEGLRPRHRLFTMGNDILFDCALH